MINEKQLERAQSRKIQQSAEKRAWYNLHIYFSGMFNEQLSNGYVYKGPRIDAEHHAFFESQSLLNVVCLYQKELKTHNFSSISSLQIRHLKELDIIIYNHSERKLDITLYGKLLLAKV
jgi:hypothetical protein